MNEKEIFEELLGELKNITNNVSAKAQETSKKIGEFAKLTARVDELEARIEKLESKSGINEETIKEAPADDIKVEDLNNDKSLDKNPVYNVFISQPMTGLSIEDIKEVREKAEKAARMYVTREYHDEICAATFYKNYINIIDNLQEDLPADTHSLEYLGNDIKMLKDADFIFFCKDWEYSRGCNIEFQVAKTYGIKMIFES